MAGERPVFFYDLVSPFSYLAAYRIEQVFPVPARWQPIWSPPVIVGSGRDWFPSFEEGRERRTDVERRAARYGMPTWRWPSLYEPPDREAHEGWQPPNTLPVLRVATLAQRAGVGEAFALGVFGLAFGEGRDISQVDDAIVEVAVGCGLDADDVLAAPAHPELKQALRDATETAMTRGVIGVPTVAVGEELFWGDDRLEDAATAVARAAV